MACRAAWAIWWDAPGSKFYCMAQNICTLPSSSTHFLYHLVVSLGHTFPTHQGTWCPQFPPPQTWFPTNLLCATKPFILWTLRSRPSNALVGLHTHFTMNNCLHTTHATFVRLPAHGRRHLLLPVQGICFGRAILVLDGRLSLLALAGSIILCDSHTLQGGGFCRKTACVPARYL